jgi:hypothetical protein
VPDAGATVSVNVTFAPLVTVVGNALSVLVVAGKTGCVTVTATAGEMLPPNVELAAYEAVIE